VAAEPPPQPRSKHDEEQQFGKTHRDELAAFHDAEAFGEQPDDCQRNAARIASGCGLADASRNVPRRSQIR
jgi:hypothetical protein